MIGPPRRLHRYSALLAALAGLAMGFLMFALSSSALIYQMVSTAELQRDATAEQVAAIGEQSRQLARRLQAEFKPDCTPENLAALNSLLFEYRFHKDIGLYDKSGRVYCSTGLGRLAHPVADPPLAHITRMGGGIWFNVPVLIGKGKLSTTMMRNGDFNMLLEPGMVRELIASTDILWFGTVDKPTHISKGISPELVQAAAALDKRGETGWHIVWSQGAVVSVLQPKDTLLRFASVRYLRDAYLGQPALSGLLLVFSTLLAILFGIWAQGRLRHLSSVGHRLPRLLAEGRLLCLYQPIVDLTTGRPVGCEVLIRVRDGEDILTPDQFIPMVRERRLTWALDSAVMHAAMREMPAILPLLRGGKVAFNLFPESIRFALIDPLLAPYKGMFAEYATAIGVEVTEYDFSDALIPELRQFEQAGYHISVDDFGTGYSNLGMVKKVAPHMLKIDKSFVFEMDQSSVRSSLIPEIVAIALAVDAEVIAEGIENGEQAHKLRSLGVPYGQGYFYGRPMPMTAFLDYLRAWEAIPGHFAEAEPAVV